MNSPRLSAVCAALGASGVLVLSTPLAFAESPSRSDSVTHVLAQAASRLDQRVTDNANVLSPEDVDRINSAIQTLQNETGLKLYVAYLDNLGGSSARNWTESAARRLNDPAAGVLVISMSERDWGFYANQGWNQSQINAFDSGVKRELAGQNLAEAAITGAASVANRQQGTSTTPPPMVTREPSNEASQLWLGTATAGLTAAGAGAWWWSRRANRKRQGDLLTRSRELDPNDPKAIAALPVETLRQRSEEVLVLVDESVREAREELTIAQNEFGPERTRPFLKALNGASSALEKAYQTRALLNDSIPETESQQRSMYTDIISSCGVAQEALNQESERFAELRNELIHAESHINNLTRRSIDLSARVEPASVTLEQLRSEFDEQTLNSVADNVELARVSLSKADNALDEARRLRELPAGQQGQLVDTMREAERALTLTDDLLIGVEHAKSNIAAAQSQLPSLMEEVRSEISEAHTLHSKRSGAVAANWEALLSAAAEAQKALDVALQKSATDPLLAHTTLLEADSHLDAQLDQARETTRSHDRLAAVVDQQLSNAAAQIEGAEDLISSRGRVIGSSARTYLAEAQRAFAQAQHLRHRDLQQAAEAARHASAAARRAADAADDDIRAHRNRQAASTGGDLITGMVIGSMLSGGGRGGYGGGFGGGSFGGGGFTGGSFGGGGFRGGSF